MRRLGLKGRATIAAFESKRITQLVRARRTTPGALLKSKTEADTAAEIQLRLRELIKLAKEQGYLTFDDLNEALPDGITDANELDAILTRLRRMEIDVIEASDVDRHKEVKKDLDRKTTRLNSSHRCISYAVFCLKKKKKE